MVAPLTTEVGQTEVCHFEAGTRSAVVKVVTLAIAGAEKSFSTDSHLRIANTTVLFLIVQQTLTTFKGKGGCYIEEFVSWAAEKCFSQCVTFEIAMQLYHCV